MKNIKQEIKLSDLLNEAEENLAYNLQWLNDQFDLRIRQGDKELIERLEMLNLAWRNIVKVANKMSREDCLVELSIQEKPLDLIKNMLKPE